MRKTRFSQMVVLMCFGSLVGCTSSGEGGTVGNTELNVIIPNGSPNLGAPGTGTNDPEAAGTACDLFATDDGRCDGSGACTNGGGL